MQGGDTAFFDDLSLLPQAPFTFEIRSTEEGYLSSMETTQIGLAAGELGAGRKTKEDKIDYGAGVILHKKYGDFVEKEEVIANFFASDKEKFPLAEKRFLSALRFSQTPPERKKLIFDIVE